MAVLPAALVVSLRTLAPLVAIPLSATITAAQARYETSRIVAGANLTRVAASFDHGSSQTEGAIGVYLGMRLTPGAWYCNRHDKPFCDQLTRLSVTPHLAFGATHVRGFDPASDPYSFSFLDLPRWKVSYRILDSLRLSFLTGGGRHTAERFDAGDIANYWTTNGTTIGFGFEIPLVKSGRGLEVSLVRLSGTFDSLETRAANKLVKLRTGANLGYRTVVFQIGWSGPFTGVSLPWQ